MVQHWQKLFVMWVCLIGFLGYTKSARSLDFKFGASVSATIIRVSDKEQNQNRATIANDSSVTPYFALFGDVIYPFESVDIGLSWKLWGSTFMVNKQKLNKGVEDIGTSLSGEYFYVLPIFFYQFGDRTNENKRNYSLSIGVGWGVSYTSMRGEIRLTEERKNQSLENRPLEIIDTQQISYAAGYFFRLEVGKYFLLATTYTPQMSRGEYVYRVNNVVWAIGRRVSIDLDFDYF